MIQIVHMCNAFAECGHEVSLYVTDRTDDPVPPETYYKMKTSFAVVRIPVLDFTTTIRRYPRAVRPFLYSIQRLSYTARFVLLLQRNRVAHDIIYGRDEWILWLLSLFCRNQRVVWESHEGKHNFPARRILKKGMPCVVISEGVFDLYINRGYPEEQFKIAHDGVDESFFTERIGKREVREKLGMERETKPVVMYIGGLEQWKGAETLFEAGGNSSRFAVYIIGGSPSECEKYARQYPQVHFLGAHPYHDLADNQQAADILVVPNTGTRDISSKFTSPLKLFAHMASGVPMVVSDVTSIKNILGGTCVTFFKADDSLSLSQAIEQVLLHRDETEDCARTLVHDARAFTWRKRAEGITVFLEGGSGVH